MSREKTLGYAGFCCALLLYGSAIETHVANFAACGSGGKLFLFAPLGALINACFWCAYGWFKQQRDYFVVAANVPGVVVGIGFLFIWATCGRF